MEAGIFGDQYMLNESSDAQFMMHMQPSYGGGLPSPPPPPRPVAYAAAGQSFVVAGQAPVVVYAQPNDSNVKTEDAALSYRFEQQQPPPAPLEEPITPRNAAAARRPPRRTAGSPLAAQAASSPFAPDARDYAMLAAEAAGSDNNCVAAKNGGCEATPLPSSVATVIAASGCDSDEARRALDAANRKRSSRFRGVTKHRRSGRWEVLRTHAQHPACAVR